MDPASSHVHKSQAQFQQSRSAHVTQTRGPRSRPQLWSPPQKSALTTEDKQLHRGSESGRCEGLLCCPFPASLHRPPGLPPRRARWLRDTELARGHGAVVPLSGSPKHPWEAGARQTTHGTPASGP